MLFGIFTLIAALVGTAAASSHSEAPGTAKGPRSDISDVYLFQSQTAGKTVLIMNGSPLQRSDAGPNYSPTDTNFVYQYHIDNNGDAHEDITFQFIFGQRFGTITGVQNSGVELSVGGVPTKIALVLFNVVTIDQNDRLNLFQTGLNSVEYYRVRVQKGDDYEHALENGPFISSFSDPSSTTFIKPFDHAGKKSFPSTAYTTYAKEFTYAPGNNALFGNGQRADTGVRIPGCNTPASLFVGPRRESFSIDLGSVFDLVNLYPIDDGTKAQDSIHNTLDCSTVLTFALEIETSCLLSKATQPIIGGWASVRTLDHTTKKGVTYHQAGEQISRLGNPLVNELFIGLTDKDLWSSEHPSRDAQFNNYLSFPTIPKILNILFGVTEPFTDSTATPPISRFDILTVLHFGVPGLNQPPVDTEALLAATDNDDDDSSSSSSSSSSDDDDDNSVTTPSAVAADILRLNTAVPATVLSNQDSQGVLAGQADGFPNGRRLGDDVVDIYLRVAVGVLCTTPFINFAVAAVPPLGAALAGNCFRLYGANANSQTSVPGTFGVPLTDLSPQTSRSFSSVFPFLLDPIPGNQMGECWRGDIGRQFDASGREHCATYSTVPEVLRPLRPFSCIPI